MTSKSKVVVIRTGGTIDSIGVDRLDLVSYADAGRRLGAGGLVGRIPEVAEVADVSERAFRGLSSQLLQIGDLMELAKLIQREADDGATGVVVAHGTSTLEETAYFLHLTLKRRAPVVVVGAMRPASGMSSDSDRNLYTAVTVAKDPAASGMGVLVVLNDTIFSARDATKSTTYRTNAFVAGDLGPLGYSDSDGAVIFYHKPVRSHTVDTEFFIDSLDGLPRVDIVVSYLGASGDGIAAAIAGGARGVVLAGSGAGCGTAAEVAALRAAAAAGVVVVQSSRVGSGRVGRTPQSGMGWVSAGNLQPWKARILLALALAHKLDLADIQRAFDSY